MSAARSHRTPESTAVPDLLRRLRSGDAEALDLLIPLVHGELRRLARGIPLARHGGGARHVPLDDLDLPLPDRPEELISLDDALARLGAVDARQERIVELRFFAGLSVEETAAVLGISPRTVKREWSVARAWLRAELGR
jgi:hypothetical protein